MTSGTIALCVQIAFTVDRIEPPWAIVEWSPTETTSDVHLSRFDSRPSEGSHWILRMELSPAGLQPTVRITPSADPQDSLSAPALTPPQPARTTKTTTGSARVHSSIDWCIEPEHPEEHRL